MVAKEYEIRFSVGRNLATFRAVTSRRPHGGGPAGRGATYGRVRGCGIWQRDGVDGVDDRVGLVRTAPNATSPPLDVGQEGGSVRGGGGGRVGQARQ